MNDIENKNVGYETSDISTRNLYISGGVLIVLLIVIIAGLNELFLANREQEVTDKVLQAESSELRELQAREAEALHSFKMLDQENGVVRIPIDRAMQLVAEEDFEQRRNR